jgi:hypothetical protein
MKVMKRYRLEQYSFDDTGTFNIYPDINASNIESQEVLDRSQSHFKTFFSGQVSFRGLFPTYGTEIEVPAEPHAICDMHTWVERKPRALVYPISPRFRDILNKFNIPEVRFYDGSVVWKNEEYQYYVLHLLTRQFQYIDFSHSTFIKCNFEGVKKKGSPIINGNSMEEVLHKLGAESFTFERAVMLPEFRNIDMYYLDIHGILITQSLKDAIEKADLTGMKISECSIDFEFSDEI